MVNTIGREAKLISINPQGLIIEIPQNLISISFPSFYDPIWMEEMAKMENEKPETQIELMDITIGEDKPQVAAKTVVIEDLKHEDVDFGKEVTKKLVLVVKHPDLQENIEISGVKYEMAGKIKTGGLWLKLDNDGKLPFNSATAHLLRFLKKAKLSELKGEQVGTVTDDKGYLLVKAY